MVMEALSERYGWTPDEIRAMDWRDVIDYLKIIAAKNAIKKANAKR